MVMSTLPLGLFSQSKLVMIVAARRCWTCLHSSCKKRRKDYMKDHEGLEVKICQLVSPGQPQNDISLPFFRHAPAEQPPPRHWLADF
eukprot:s1362_g7.t1